MTKPTTPPTTTPPGFDWSSLGGRKFSGGIALGLLTLLVDRFTAEGLNPQTMWALVALYGLFVLADAIITAAHAFAAAPAPVAPPRDATGNPPEPGSR